MRQKNTENLIGERFDPPTTIKKRLRLAGSTIVSLAVLASAVGSNDANAEEDKLAETPTEMFFVAQEDEVLSKNENQAQALATEIKEAGFDTLKVTVPWTYPAQCSEVHNDTDRFQNAVKAAKDNGLNLAVNLIPQKDGRPGYAPISTSQIRCYGDTIVSYMHNFAHLNPGGKLVIEYPNEPNDEDFWRPQKDMDGSWIAPEAVAKMAVQVRPKIERNAEKLGIEVETYGPGLTADDDPMRFVSEFGNYLDKVDFRGEVFDGFSLHPYGLTPSEAPDKQHPAGKHIGFADFEDRKDEVKRVFGKTTKFWYSEYGVREQIRPELASLYEKLAVFSDKFVSEATQADYYEKAVEMAYCQDIPLTIFNVRDERDGEWTSGIFRPDGTKKLAYYAVKGAIERSKNDGINCKTYK